MIVYIPADHVAESLLAAAKSLAARTDASVIAMHIIPPIQIHADAAMAIGADFTQSQILLNREEADKARNACAEAANSLGLEYEWLERDAGAAPLMAEVGRSCRIADLAVIPEADPTVPAMITTDPAEIILGCGRPVLIVPRGHQDDIDCRSVMIAWNGSRESARAAFDCLSILPADANIRIASIGDQDHAAEPHRSAAALCDTLARRGYDCQACPMPAVNMSIGEKIRSLAEEWSIDLIVMGCYGHSRLRETIFGGTTREVLSKFSVPILMAH